MSVDANLQPQIPQYVEYPQFGLAVTDAMRQHIGPENTFAVDTATYHAIGMLTLGKQHAPNYRHVLFAAPGEEVTTETLENMHVFAPGPQAGPDEDDPTPFVVHVGGDAQTGTPDLSPKSFTDSLIVGFQQETLKRIQGRSGEMQGPVDKRTTALSILGKLTVVPWLLARFARPPQIRHDIQQTIYDFPAVEVVRKNRR